MKKYVAFLCIVLNFTVLSESFVKEKAKKTKKVSHSRCQEESIVPLTRLIEQSNISASKAHRLVVIGNQIVQLGNQFLFCSLEKQNFALESTADLIYEDYGGGRFAGMTLSDLENYCQGLEKISSDLVLAQELIDNASQKIEKIVNDLSVNELFIEKNICKS